MRWRRVLIYILVVAAVVVVSMETATAEEQPYISGPRAMTMEEDISIIKEHAHERQGQRGDTEDSGGIEEGAHTTASAAVPPTHHHGGTVEPSIRQEGIPEPWASLAECESNGEWDYGPHSGWGSGIFHGGLQFHPETWEAYREVEDPVRAYEATPQRQIAVAERVLAEQGWGAWPACSRELGLR